MPLEASVVRPHSSGIFSLDETGGVIYTAGKDSCVVESHLGPDGIKVGGNTERYV